MLKQTWLIAAAIAWLMVLAGFDTRNAVVPRSEILSGGPPKDGIPALLEPRFIDAESATYLKGDDQVLGVYINGEAKAYPINILNWHEAVNDTAGGQPVVATF